jgi:hypothetical protein
VIEIAWRAQHRLHQRWTVLPANAASRRRRRDRLRPRARHVLLGGRPDRLIPTPATTAARCCRWADPDAPHWRHGLFGVLRREPSGAASRNSPLNPWPAAPRAAHWAAPPQRSPPPRVSRRPARPPTRPARRHEQPDPHFCVRTPARPFADHVRHRQVPPHGASPRTTPVTHEDGVAKRLDLVCGHTCRRRARGVTTRLARDAHRRRGSTARVVTITGAAADELGVHCVYEEPQEVSAILAEVVARVAATPWCCAQCAATYESAAPL